MTAAASDPSMADPTGMYGGSYPPSSSSSGLTGGEIAGITVAAIGAAVALATTLGMFAAFMRRRTQR